jgi:hypothetical protein
LKLIAAVSDADPLPEFVVPPAVALIVAELFVSCTTDWVFVALTVSMNRDPK